LANKYPPQNGIILHKIELKVKNAVFNDTAKRERMIFLSVN